MAHLGFSENEYGTRISLHRCDICAVDFTVCPAHENNIPCGVQPCSSYDPAHDVDKLLREGSIEIVEVPEPFTKA